MLAARFAGSKLVFLDIEEEGYVAQVVCNVGTLVLEGTSDPEWSRFRHVVRRGDWYSR